MKEPFTEDLTIGELAKNFKDKILSVNPEYQRAVVWSETQCQMFWDSILRKHYMPLIYLRQKPGGEGRYEIIDGQQRINAIYGFVYDQPVIAYTKKSRATTTTDGWQTNRRPVPPLLVPKDSDLFPSFLQHTECPWAGKKFSGFSPELKKASLARTLSAVIIDGNDAETRDMFIRLQGGSALTEQEIRDGWPGDFCEFVLTIGGKESMKRKGHDFFNHVFRRPSPDRGQVRQLVAQAFMLLLRRKNHGKDAFCSIQATELDSCYRQYASVENSEYQENKERFREILDSLHSWFKDVPLSRKIQNDDFIHLVLFLDSLLDDDSALWEKAAGGGVGAFKTWRERVKCAEEIKKKGLGRTPPEFRPATRYNESKGPSASKIKARHEIFVSEMQSLLGIDG